ncbi:MAG: hypothetical protein WKG32_01830 [Gemmatimonadaceae bacterium]
MDTSLIPYPYAARLATLAAALSLAGCVGPFDSCGTDEGRDAVQVTVIDARTGGPPTARPTLVVTEGAYADTGRAYDPLQGARLILSAGPERPGTYALTVTAQGYRTWARSGVRVRRGGRCDRLETVQLTARLEPEP